MTTIDQTISSIIECAIRWNSEDADHPDTPPQHWQDVIPLLRAAPRLLEEALHAVQAMEKAGIGFNETGLRAAIAEATGRTA